MQTQPLKIGDVVRPRAGGAPMTVQALGDDVARCVWFVGTELRKQSFAIGNLVVDPKGGDEA